MKKLCTVAASLLACVAVAPAQWSGAVQVTGLVDDNAFNNSLQINDRLTEVALQGAYDWATESSNVQLFYVATLDYFSLMPSRSFQVHSPGLAYSQLLGNDEETLLNAGGTFTLRDNRDGFTIYDHSQVLLYGNLTSYLSDEARMSGGYSFRSVWFREWDELDYLEHSLFFRSTFSFPTRTTVITQADLGFKRYTTPTPTASGSSGSMGGNASDQTTPGVTQLSGTVRIGQGITDGTGISLTGQYQVSLAKESRYLSFEDGILTDDEVFDDHYGYDGPLGSIMLTQMLTTDLRFRASASVQQRQYSNRPAYDLLGQIVASQRVDTRSVLSLSIDKSFPSLGLQLILAYDHIINASNDIFYTYRNNAISLSLSLSQ